MLVLGLLAKQAKSGLFYYNQSLARSGPFAARAATPLHAQSDFGYRWRRIHWF